MNLYCKKILIETIESNMSRQRENHFRGLSSPYDTFCDSIDEFVLDLFTENGDDYCCKKYLEYTEE